MRDLGIGISNQDLERIPIGPAKEAAGADLEFARRHNGRIFLQVEEDGQAWYVYPEDSRRYYLGRPRDAWELMRSLGLGVANADLDKIIAANPQYPMRDFSLAVHKAVNKERVLLGADELLWNQDLADVARQHSLQLARENQGITRFGAACDYPVIHHEGLEIGPYLSDRLDTNLIHYYRKNGENIALVSAAAYQVLVRPGSGEETSLENCREQMTAWNNELKQNLDKIQSVDTRLAIIRAELDRRKGAFADAPEYPLDSVRWLTRDEAAVKTVQGWLDSPGHRENMLDTEFDEAGIGSVYINGYLISTQVFITRTGCAYLKGPCCEKEGYYPYCFEGLECKAGVCVDSS
jgi:uncharacterized protein YkwD